MKLFRIKPSYLIAFGFFLVTTIFSCKKTDNATGGGNQAIHPEMIEYKTDKDFLQCSIKGAASYDTIKHFTTLYFQQTSTPLFNTMQLSITNCKLDSLKLPYSFTIDTDLFKNYVEILFYKKINDSLISDFHFCPGISNSTLSINSYSESIIQGTFQGRFYTNSKPWNPNSIPIEDNNFPVDSIINVTGDFKAKLIRK